jgi:hypothetical protein
MPVSQDNQEAIPALKASTVNLASKVNLAILVMTGTLFILVQ